PHSAPPFPYTTLFRSKAGKAAGEPEGRGRLRQATGACAGEGGRLRPGCGCLRLGRGRGRPGVAPVGVPGRPVLIAVALGDRGTRSEEHTSELQSRENL